MLNRSSESLLPMTQFVGVYTRLDFSRSLGPSATSIKGSLKNRLHILSLFPRLSQGAQLLKKNEFGLELKRRGRFRVLTDRR